MKIFTVRFIEEWSGRLFLHENIHSKVYRGMVGKAVLT